MKKIKPIQMWYNGVPVNATRFYLVGNGDNLSSQCSFSYYLYSVSDNENLTQVQSGALIMDGEAYQNWQTNEYAYDWAATKLNLELEPEGTI
jgi:hypothetical protein